MIGGHDSLRERSPAHANSRSLGLRRPFAVRALSGHPAGAGPRRARSLADRPARAGSTSMALAAALPGLADHGCSYREPGGFFRRMREDEGTWLGHVLEHVAIELQNVAGEEVTFGKTRSADKPGVYTVVYEYAQRDEGVAAGDLGLRLLCSLLPESLRPAGSVPEGWSWPEARDDFIRFAQRRALGPSTASLVRAAEVARHPVAAPQRSIARAARARQVSAAYPGNGLRAHAAHRRRAGERQGRDEQDPCFARTAGAAAGARAERHPGSTRREAHRLSGRHQAVQRQSRPRHFHSAHDRRGGRTRVSTSRASTRVR